MTHAEWEETLDEMIYGLTFVVRDTEDFDFEGDFVRAQEGLRLFGKWFQALWA